ncbi:GerMN domain-containing protein [Geobacillus sp. C56-T2]|uniref:GerMN domain-containing protein n=1 Tax=Geobacillus sp. C56-T2 TaxID=600773 RepID=UPI0011AB90FC|nr:GerMN domain-containing protein [Geobacillus sp. C56-T2]TWG31020.1 sporulation and spore germination protein [Geobacillus sp. C56-T2]
MGHVKKFQWSEQCIEHGLKQMPTVKDRRSKEDIYQQWRRAQQARWKRRWRAAAAVATVLIAVALGGQRWIAPEHEEKQKAASPAEMTPTNSASAPAEMMMTADAASKAAEQNETVAVIALPDRRGGFVVPVAVPLDDRLAPAERVAAAIDELSRTRLRDAARWFDGVTVVPEAEDGRTWAVDVPAGHRVFAASGKEQQLFLAAVTETVRQMGGRRLHFFTAGKEGLNLPAVGRLHLSKIGGQKRMYYISRTSSFPAVVLIPAPSDASTLLEALQRMTKPGGSGLEPAVPQGVEITGVKVDERHATIRLRVSVSLDTQDAARMVEAMLLTAKEFGIHDVTLAAAGRSSLGSYRLGERIAVPPGPNPEVVAAAGR